MPRKSKNDPPPVSVDAEREAIAAWVRQEIQAIRQDADARVQRALTVGEHPMPLYSTLVQHHAGMQIDPPEIAMLLNIPYSTLMLYYENDVILGKARIKLRIAENMVRIATSLTDKDAARVGMTFLKSVNENMREKKEVEINDHRDDARIIDSSKLSPEQRQQLRLMIESVQEEVEED